MAKVVSDKFYAASDLNNLVKQNDSDPKKIRAAFEEIKGFGPLGIDLFCAEAQGVLPCLAPFIDGRSLKTPEQIRLGGDLETLWNQAGKNPRAMCKLARRPYRR